MSRDEAILEEIRAAAAAVGLELRATSPVDALPARTQERIRTWLAEGRHGAMGYLAANGPLLSEPRAWKPWARGLLLFALPYARAAGSFRNGGRVARYALGRDYHNALGKRLERLGRHLRADGLIGAFRACTDAVPLAEREWHIERHVGWRGKNTLVLDPDFGPWVLLGELLIDQELPPYRKPVRRWASCGSCTRCLDICPTGALDAAWSLDARLCLSYLTIELRTAIPPALREAMGDWVFGCDLCLEVCPFGDHAGEHAEAWGTHPALEELDLETLLRLDEEAFARHFRGSPLRRPGRIGMARNAAVVLGNLGRGGAALAAALRADPSPLVRGHAAWALGRLGDRAPLEAAHRSENDPEARAEIAAALEAGRR